MINTRKKKIVNKVIVIGKTHHNSLGIIRSLGKIDCKIFFIAVASKNSYVTKSKYIKEYWYGNTEAEILDILLNKFACEKKKPIIIPGDDYSETIIDKNISKLDGKFLYPNIKNKQSSVLENMNKIKMNLLAEKCGFLVPKSCTLNLNKIHSIDKVINNINIKYPCIVKPLQSIDGTKGDISINNSSKQLQEKLIKLKENYTEILIQEFIEKDGELGIQGLSTITSNKVIIPGIIKKLRQSSIALGSTTYGKLIKKNLFVDVNKIKLLVSQLQYKGIFDIELIYSNGNVYFIEFNFRNGAYGYAFTKAGVNIPVLWCLDAIGEDISNETNNIKQEINLMNEISDFRNILEKKVSLFKWIIQFFRTDAHLIINKSDLKPFIYKLIYR